jgi:phage-related protein
MSEETKTTEAAEDSAQLRAEIEETRAELTETIDAIQAKLDPQHIKDEVVEKIHDATIGRVEDLAHSAAKKIGPSVEYVGDQFEDVAKKLGAVAGPAVQAAQDVGRKVVRVARRQPIVTAAAGVAIAGLVIGWQFLAPRGKSKRKW